jgi:hypothetical protein
VATEEEPIRLGIVNQLNSSERQLFDDENDNRQDVRPERAD